MKDMLNKINRKVAIRTLNIGALLMSAWMIGITMTLVVAVSTMSLMFTIDSKGKK